MDQCCKTTSYKTIIETLYKYKYEIFCTSLVIVAKSLKGKWLLWHLFDDITRYFLHNRMKLKCLRADIK